MSNAKKATGLPYNPAPDQGLAEDQLFECLTVLMEAVREVTTEELDGYDEREVEFLTATWQTVELTLRLAEEHAQLLEILAVLAEESRAAADAAERTASGLIVPPGTSQ